MGFLAPVLGEIGSAAGSAAGAIGSGLGDVASTLGSLFGGDAASAGASTAGGLASGTGFVPALTNIGNAITGASAPSEAGYLAGLGQAVPAGVDLLGPSATFTGGSGIGGFMHGLMQGYRGTAAELASPSAATSAGTGLGQLYSALQQLPQAQMPALPPSQPIVQTGHPGTRILPGKTAQEGPPSTGPIMALLHDVLGGL